jgi:hypothetical protein
LRLERRSLARVIAGTGFPACADSMPPTFSEILYHPNTITILLGSVNPSSLASLRGKKISPWPKSIQNLFCHPERSEGSQLMEKVRFFAALRMTLLVKLRFYNTFSFLRV